jgi:hypothetical protein
MGLEGKVALVTGASRGIGRAIALRLANDRAAVVVNCAGSESQAQVVVADIEKAGGQAIAVCADVSEVPDVEVERPEVGLGLSCGQFELKGNRQGSQVIRCSGVFEYSRAIQRRRCWSVSWSKGSPPAGP